MTATAQSDTPGHDSEKTVADRLTQPAMLATKAAQFLAVCNCPAPLSCATVVFLP
jgi:hypothetical protein